MNDHYQDLIEELGASVVKTHTPEPWTIRGPVKVDGADDYAIMAKGQIICETFGRTSNSNYEPSLANAKLIVVAPLMLAELERLERFGDWIKSWLAKGNPEPMWYEDFMQEIENARSVIAKAKGQ